MSEIDEMKRLVLELDKQGRTQDAAKLAEQIRALSAPQGASPQAAAPEEQSWNDAASSAIPNLLSDTWEAAKGIGSGIAHPVDVGLPATVKALEYPGKLLAGLVNKIPGQTPDTSSEGQQKRQESLDTLQATVDNYKGYLSEKGLKQKLAHPGGALMDIATLLTGGSGLAAKVPMLARSAEIAGKAGRVIAPTKLPAMALQKIAGTAREARSPGMRAMSDALRSGADPSAPGAWALSPGTEELAKQAVRDPGKALDARRGLLDAVQQHLDTAQNGPTQQLYNETRQGARRLAVDADALAPMVAKAYKQAENSTELVDSLDKIKKTLTLPKTKDPIDRASQVWNTYDTITRQQQALAKQGLRTEPLDQLAGSVRALMTQDPDIAEVLAKKELADKRAATDNRTAKGIVKAGDEMSARDAKLSWRDLMRAVPYSHLGGGAGAGLGYMLMSGNYSPLMYALGGAGGGMLAKGGAKAVKGIANKMGMGADAAKANMMNMLSTSGAGVEDMLKKVEDYKGKGLSTNSLIENLLLALAQGHRLQQPQQQ